MHFPKILVTTDFSEDSLTAFDLSSYEAKMEGTKVHLLAVVEDWEVPPGFLREIPNPEAISSYRKDLLERAEEKLQEYESRFFHGQDVTCKAILSSNPVAQEICDYAKEQKINAIVMASHGRGGFGAFLLGSVVQKVIKSAPCPVVVIPRKE